MLKAVLTGLIMALILALSAMPALGQEGRICGGPSFLNATDEEVVGLVNGTEDDVRWCMYAHGELPEQSDGYVYAEDFSLVPTSFYAAWTT